MWLAFESGDQEVFAFDGKTETLSMVESEKQKEHEAPLTGLDYNRKLGLMVSSCAHGSIRIWSRDKKFMREISFPHKVDSVCFYNAQGDILVSHEQRVSLVAYAKYKTETFEYIANSDDAVRLVPASDELFEELKIKDDQVRGKQVQRARQAAIEGTKSPKQAMESRPVSAATLAAEAMFDLVHRQEEKTPLEEVLATERARRERQRAKAGQELAERVAKTVRETFEELADRRERVQEAEDTRARDNDYISEDAKPYKVTALPPIKRKVTKMRPMPGVSYLSTSGLYEDMIKSRKPFQLGHMTRRNITEHKISSNILSHNSPIGVQNFDSLNLGPQLARHKRFAS